MDAVPVLIKWGKQRIPVEIDYTESPMIFKAQLMTLTRVPIERQKIIYKGKILDDEEWDGFKVNNNTILTLVGTDEEIPISYVDSKNTNQVLTEKHDDISTNKTKDIPLGFTNLGNTCYVNASLQLIKTITPIKDLILAQNTDHNEIHQSEKVAGFLQSLKAVYKTSEPGVESYRLQINVNMLVSAVELLMPEFSSRDDHGSRVQQDANEFIIKVLNILKDSIQPQEKVTGTDAENLQVSENDLSTIPISSKYNNVIDTYLSIEYEQTTTLKENSSYVPTKTEISETIISLTIDADVRDLIKGIKKRMEDTVEIFHEESNQNKLFSRQMKFKRLPAFFMVHLGRFFYKSKQNICAKVLREVKLPFKLDLYSLCTEELQATLIKMRTVIDRHADNANNEIEMASNDNNNNENIVVVDDNVPSNTDEKSNTITEPKNNMVYSLPEQNLDVGSSGSALYNLKALVTHKGRYSNSGHYVAWVKVADNVWAKLDDIEVTIVNDDQIKKLFGGGEWHTAYVALYEAVTVPFDS